MNDIERSLRTARQETNDLEQYGRRTMCTVKGIPSQNGDDIVINLAKHLEIEIENTHIDLSHRLSGKKDADIIVKFTDRRSRNMFDEGRKIMKTKKQMQNILDFKQKVRYL